MKKRNYNKDVKLTLKFRSSDERDEWIEMYLQVASKEGFIPLYDKIDNYTWRQKNPYMVLHKDIEEELDI